jgi:magnesium chelatase accessory protein
MGAAAGPIVLLLHGSGAATHSWRWLAPLLGETYTVIAPDLPGHGFTSRPASADRLSIAGMAADVAALLAALDVPAPALVVGHSAGGAIALRMALDGTVAPEAIVGINAALAAPPIVPVVTPLVRVLASAPLTADALTTLCDVDRAVERIIRSGGSVIPMDQVALYAYLARSPARVNAVFTMMSRWDLSGLWRDVAARGVASAPPVTLIASDRDRFVPPGVAEMAARRLPEATVETLAGLGHLAHEEDAARVARIILGVR